jgi:hypothetical protein
MQCCAGVAIIPLRTPHIVWLSRERAANGVLLLVCRERGMYLSSVVEMWATPTIR